MPQNNKVKSTQKTFRILEKLKELNGATVTELTNELDLPKSSVHNYLNTLKDAEYVVQDDGNKYHVGLRFLDLGSFARQRRQIYRVAKPEVAKLADETGELANLLVEEHGRGVYLYRKTGQKAVKVDSYTGQRVFLHNTALGKAILANLPRDRVGMILDRHGLPATTDNTITDRETLFEELETIQQEGIAFDNEERLRGLRCVAVPIVTKNDRVEGAISIAGPSSRITGERFTEKLPELLRNAVNVVELNTTYA